MSLKACHHHGFTVSNLEKSLAYYRDFLGLELIRVSERKDLPSYDRIIGHDNIHLHVALLRHPADGTQIACQDNGRFMQIPQLGRIGTNPPLDPPPRRLYTDPAIELRIPLS